MVHYIDKDALVAEIERLDESNIFLSPTKKYNESYKCGYEHALEDVLDLINTFEVEEEKNIEEKQIPYPEISTGKCWDDGNF